MIYPGEGDNPEKSGLIPRTLPLLRFREEKFRRSGRSLRPIMVVGGVKAYQAEDG